MITGELDKAVVITPYLRERAAKEKNPFAAAAMLRCLVRLDDGREGRLFYWGKQCQWAKVYVDGRHERVLQSQVIEFITEASS